MTDLVQTPSTALATRTLRDQQRADRFDVAIAMFRDSCRAARQRRPCRFDRVDRIRLPRPAAQLPVGAIHLNHRQPSRTQITGEAGAVRAGAFHPNLRDPTEPTQPVSQRNEPRGRRGKRSNVEHTAIRVERGSDMSIEVGIDSTRDETRRIYDGHCHPFSVNG